MSNAILGNERVLKYSEIRSIYESGYKHPTDLKVGVEYERIPIAASGKVVSYYGEKGVCEFLRAFASLENWDYILDESNIIGLKQGHNTITLEPGCQIEMSLEPVKSLDALSEMLDGIDSIMQPCLNKFGISLINYGVSPLSTYKEINLIPKRRYEIMAKYLWGFLSDVMMRETAGIQGTFDFVNEDDAVRKYKSANMLVPFMTAMFANSPIRGGVDTGYKTFRALSWLNTDNDRCGFSYDFKPNYTFDDYINYVLENPMLFINRNNNYIKLNGKLNFKKFMSDGYKEYFPGIDDYLLQANLCFPEVRLRNFIEVRNQDCGTKEALLSVLAIYKGILYDTLAMEDLETLFKEAKYSDFYELRYSVPKAALNATFSEHKVLDIAKEIVLIAEKALKRTNLNEEKYLDYINNLLNDNMCPADVILKNWYGSWNKDMSKFLKYITVKNPS